MTKKFAAIILLFALSGAGFATSNEGGKHHHEGGKQKPTNVTQPAKPASTSASSSAAASAGAIGIGVGIGMGGQGGNGGTGGSGGLGGQGGTGGSAAGGTAIASVGAMNFAFTVPGASGPSTAFVQHDYSGMPQQAPAMGNSYISTSNGCDGASGLGVVFPGGGVNFSSTALRMMCEGRLNSQAHKALGDEDKARRVMRVVDEYACSQDAVWAKIAREEGLCKPDTAPPATPTNSAFNSAG